MQDPGGYGDREGPRIAEKGKTGSDGHNTFILPVSSRWGRCGFRQDEGGHQSGQLSRSAQHVRQEQTVNGEICKHVRVLLVWEKLPSAQST